MCCSALARLVCKITVLSLLCSLWLRVLSSVLSLQGADDLVSPDALSTVREMDVANFRRVPRLSIYGMAQPSIKVTNNAGSSGPGEG